MILESKKHHIIPLLAGLKVPDSLVSTAIVWYYFTKRMPPYYTPKFARIFPRLARKHSIPFWDYILADVGGDFNQNISDGIHPNIKGHRTIGRHFANFLQEHVPMPPL